MANSEKRPAGADPDAATEPLPALVGRLGEDIVTLLDSKLSLVKLEIKEDVNAYVRGSLTVGAGGLVAALGFALLSVAVAFLISAFFEDLGLSRSVQHALGFLITAVLCLVIGALVFVKTKARWGRESLMPARSIDELAKDKRWLSRQL